MKLLAGLYPINPFKANVKFPYAMNTFPESTEMKHWLKIAK